MGREGSRGGADLMQGPSQSVEDFEINAGLRDPRDSSTDAEHRQQVEFCQCLCNQDCKVLTSYCEELYPESCHTFSKKTT